MRRLILVLSVGWMCLILSARTGFSADAAPKKWLQSTPYVVPKYTATEGEGYFAIIEGLNRRLYIGTHANGVNSWLVEFDPKRLVICNRTWSAGPAMARPTP